MACRSITGFNPIAGSGDVPDFTSGGNIDGFTITGGICSEILYSIYIRNTIYNRVTETHRYGRIHHEVKGVMSAFNVKLRTLLANREWTQARLASVMM